MRLLRILVKNSIKIITLLLAVSIVSFTLVSISPIDPVQQYLCLLYTSYTLSVTGNDVKSMTQSLVAESVSISAPDRSSFDIKA